MASDTPVVYENRLKEFGGDSFCRAIYHLMFQENVMLAVASNSAMNWCSKCVHQFMYC
jgi:hypothetical protein